jgi:CBS domain-containing protein
MKSDRPATESHKLRVRTRETLDPGGNVTRSSTVHCPKRDGTATMKECLLCRSCAGLEMSDPEQYIVCEVVPEEIAMGPPRRHRVRRPTEGDKTPLSAVMSRDLVCVSPDLPVEELVALLVDRGFSGVPVVDPQGKPIGVVSKSDLLGGKGGELVRDIMMPIAFTLPESASLSHAAALMAYESIHRIPVVAMDGEVIGLVSSLDIVRWVAEQDGYVVGRTR